MNTLACRRRPNHAAACIGTKQQGETTEPIQTNVTSEGARLSFVFDLLLERRTFVLSVCRAESDTAAGAGLNRGGVCESERA